MFNQHHLHGGHSKSTSALIPNPVPTTATQRARRPEEHGKEPPSPAPRPACSRSFSDFAAFTVHFMISTLDQRTEQMRLLPSPFEWIPKPNNRKLGFQLAMGGGCRLCQSTHSLMVLQSIC
ncbi:unnamed protein product [Urochloa humidicola]